MVNLELYRVFYTVARCGSLTKAAEELYISQPAVSQSIKQLENQLGVRLFNRTHKGMELSAQGGQMIFAEVEQALALLNAAENRVAEMKTSATGLIRIGASDTIFEYFLADKIVDFHEQFPNVKIELLADFTPDTIEKLKANHCDVAFVNLPIDVDEELMLQGNCMRLNDIFIVGEKYKDLANGDALSLSDLTKYPLIMMDKHTVARRALVNFLGAHGVELQPSIEVGSWDLMKRLVLRGMGIGVIPREYAGRLGEEGLYEVKTDPALPPRSVGMLLPKNANVSYALHSFLEFVKKSN
jgi:DNA-binding transcriptional LysR family regulator